MIHDGWRILPLAALAVAPAYAAEYLTVEVAQRAAFPDASAFVPVAFSPTADMRVRLAEIAQPPGARDPRIWRAMSGGKWLGTFYADAVIGKHPGVGAKPAFRVDHDARRLGSCDPPHR